MLLEQDSPHSVPVLGVIFQEAIACREETAVMLLCSQGFLALSFCPKRGYDKKEKS